MNTKVEKDLRSRYPSVRASTAYDQSWTVTPDQMDKGLFDTSHVVRIAWIRRCRLEGYTPCHKRVLRGMRDVVEMVRFEWAKWRICGETDEQLEVGLRDASARIRRIYAFRPPQVQLGQIVGTKAAYPTMIQFQRGLDDPDPDVRHTWSCNTYYRPTATQIEKGLTDRNDDVRSVWARRSDFTPSAQQMDRGLRDKKWLVRHFFASRKDFTPTPEQVERGLVDMDPFVRSAWAGRTDYVPTHEQVARGLADPDPAVRMAFFRNDNVLPSIEQAHDGLKDEDEGVRDACVRRMPRVLDVMLCEDSMTISL